MSINGSIEVSSVPNIELSQNATPGGIPLTNELCLGLTDTVYGFAAGLQVGNFSGNNVNNGIANDGFAILNTSTGPVINEPITFTYTDVNGCTVDSTWLFTVHDQPVVSIVNTNNDICFGDSLLLQGLGDGNTGVGNFYSNDGITDTTVAGEAWFNSNFAQPDSNYVYYYEFTDVNGCTNITSDFLYVNDLPVAGVNIDGYEFCSNDTANVNAIPLPGPDDSLYFNGVYETYDPTGFYEVVAGNYPNGIITVQYYYIDNNGCKAYAEDSMLVYPTPSVGFTFNSNCITDTIDFVDTTITNGATVADYSWTFSDGFASSSQDTSVLFQYGGQKVITFEVTSTAGCSDSYQLIEWFGEKPRVDFDWTNECLIGGVSNTQFVNNTPAIDSVTMWSWSFGDPGNNTSTQFEPLFDYTQNGSYLVTVIGETDYGCIDTAMKAIWIREYVQSYPYFADFETGNYGWVPDTLVGVNNSWEWGAPSGTTINSAYSGSNVLMTSLNDNHNNNEFSFIISPCFDFSQLKRPMIKIKLWGETNQGDGMKIEYGDQGADYFPLGTVDKGINWYDDFVTGLIEADPNNTTSPEGWFGSTGGWIDARYQLDTLVGDTMVRFKIIFGSDIAQTLDGFAIDDIWIGERERTVLVEHFTNYTDGLSQISTPVFNGVIDEPTLNDYSMDLVNVQYHTRQTTSELLNANYPSGPSARQNYYGLDSIPYVINDGIAFRGTVSAWYNDLEKLESRTLVDPQFAIDLNMTQTGANIDVQVDFTSNEDIGNKEVVVRIAVVEDSVDLSGFGVSGIHRNTLLSFLPGASGTSFSQIWNIGSTGSVFQSTTVTNGFNLNNLDVVVWIQDKDSKEVYQAISGKISTILGLTGVHDESAAMDFMIYPNPTIGSATLLLNNSFKENGQIYIHDASGRLIETLTINKFQEQIELSNKDYKNGMYFVSVVNPQGQKMTKKMVVQKH
ncbi:MAG: T9SS type A sorting domain-containing protein [Crocinitomicaceae bacterium]|nr:T9SS type A sorting domain-containing protein [Crocinitomicaceae bacterium]